eukprot:TRINITY_DN44994_c0_g1_i1.p1 TRINITY_DN44994_c0_g1~~TRINITY_DN44994_c0_g1_i1.p1  ORF type:complete len:318 (+),score=40.51 TRINITY_DN44994_c0_g1_i1:438-1391(+)
MAAFSTSTNRPVTPRETRDLRLQLGGLQAAAEPEFQRDVQIASTGTSSSATCSADLRRNAVLTRENAELDDQIRALTSQLEAAGITPRTPRLTRPPVDEDFRTALSIGSSSNSYLSALETLPERSFPYDPGLSRREGGTRNQCQQRLIQILHSVGDNLPMRIQGSDAQFVLEGLVQGPHRDTLVPRLIVGDPLFVDFQCDADGNRNLQVRNVYARLQDGSVEGPFSWQDFYAPNRTAVGNRRMQVKKAIAISHQWRTHRDYTTISQAYLTDLVMQEFGMSDLNTPEPTRLQVSTNVFVQGGVYDFIDTLLRAHYSQA